MKTLNRANHKPPLLDHFTRNDTFFKGLIERGIIEYKSANTRKAFSIIQLDSPVPPLGRTFRDWVDYNRLPNSTGYEKALVWYDHNKELTSGSLRFTGKDLNLYLDTPCLQQGNTSHHRTQYCHVIFWSKLQLMQNSEVEQVFNGWLKYLEDFFNGEEMACPIHP